MPNFDTTRVASKDDILARFGPKSGPRVSRTSRLEMLKPYIDAVRPLVADVSLASSMTLTDDDKPQTERLRLQRAYLHVLGDTGSPLPSNGLVIRRVGNDVGFWIDPDATEEAPKVRRPRAPREAVAAASASGKRGAKPADTDIGF